MLEQRLITDIFKISDPGNIPRDLEDLFCNTAGNDIYLIYVCNRDKDIRLLRPGLFKDGRDTALADNDSNVCFSCYPL
jgi:hypothetical protein